MRIPTKYGFSVEVNPNSYLAQYLQSNGAYEVPESELIRSLVRPGDFCIDAGAHVGYFAALLLQSGAKVLAIEPNPNHKAALLGNMAGGIMPNEGEFWDLRKHDRVVMDVALSSTEDAAWFFMPSEFDDGWGSLCCADKPDAGAVAVVTMRLDSMLGRLHYEGPIRLMKMDVEGAEVPALQGAGERLADMDYILIECIDIPSRTKLGSTVAGINEIFAGWQVQAYRSGRWSPVEQAVSSGENFLFINPKGNA